MDVFCGAARFDCSSAIGIALDCSEMGSDLRGSDQAFLCSVWKCMHHNALCKLMIIEY